MTRSRTALTKIALVAALMTGLTALAPAPAGAGTLSPRARMYRATNTSRVLNDVRRVDMHWRISKLARKHSIKMASTPDGSGGFGKLFHTKDPASYYLKGTSWSTWGENVGVTGGSVADLHHAFMDSPVHRANIVNQRFRRVALGTYRDDDGLLWVTVFFYG
ncbi:MAG TPA: CAP domain-containing protein [Actinomycetota bacterium]